MEVSPNRGSDRLALGAILAVAAFLRFFRIGHQSLWVDEILSFKAFTSPAGVPYWKKFLHDVHGPLYSLIMHFWGAVSGSDAWLRAPSAVAGILAVYFLYRWLNAGGRRSIALPAALFMAISPFHLFYSQEVRFYSLLSLFVVLALMAFERFLEAPTARRGALFGAALAVACLAHFSGFLLAAALFVYLVTRRPRGPLLRNGALAALIALAAISPWIYREVTVLRAIHVVDISTLPVAERLRGDLTLSRWSYPYAVYAFSVGYSFGPSLPDLHAVSSPAQLLGSYAPQLAVAAIVFGALAAAGLIRAAREGQAALFLTVILATVLLLVVIARFNVKVFNVRYLMCIFPFYLALIAYGLPRGGPARYLIAGVASAVMLVSDYNYLFVERYGRENVREAVSIVAVNERPGDLIIATTVHAVFEHYYRGPNAVVAVFPVVIGRDALEKKEVEYVRTHARVWYVRSRTWDRDPEDLLLKTLPEHGKVVGSWQLSGVLLNLYDTETPHARRSH